MSQNYADDVVGNRVKVTQNGLTTVYIGNHAEWQVEIGRMTKYYYANGQRIAMRVGGDNNNNVSFPLTDHLGSTSVTLNYDGTKRSELRYMPFGKTRYTDGDTPTQRRFTGQIEDSSTGLYFYNARYYDPMLGRFIQPDSIVPEPGNPQAWNRYSYVYNNPLRYTDPTGHFSDDEVEAAYGVDDVKDIWWWNDPAYDGWQQILINKDTTWGDVIVTEVDGVTYRAMFVATDTGAIVLWDIDNRQAIHPELFANPNRWQVFRSQSQDYRNFRRITGKNGHHFVEPTLSGRWQYDWDPVSASSSWSPRIKAGYAYPDWTWADTRNVAIAAATGAGTGAFGGPKVALAGAIIVGGGAALVIVDQKINNATMMPIVSNHSDVMTGRPKVWSTRHHRSGPR